MKKQPDWARRCFRRRRKDGHRRAAGRLARILRRADGAKRAAQAAAAKPAAAKAPKPPAKPALERLEPRGIQRGGAAQVRLVGSNLAGLRFVACAGAGGARGILRRRECERSAAYRQRATPTLTRGDYDISVVGADGKNCGEREALRRRPPAGHPTRGDSSKLPASIWGDTRAAGRDRAHPDSTPRPGRRSSSTSPQKPSAPKPTPSSPCSTRTAACSRATTTSTAPAIPFSRTPSLPPGATRWRCSDAQFAGSREHFFRLSVGELPFVTGCFPLGVPANRESEVELTGFQLPAGRKVKVAAGAPGEMPCRSIPRSSARAARSRSWSAICPTLSKPSRTTRPRKRPPRKCPPAIGGRSDACRRRDLFKFDAKKGTVWAIETQAAQRGSPTDTKIEVLDAGGRPVERLLLQAVRDSAITFRPIDSVDRGCPRGKLARDGAEPVPLSWRRGRENLPHAGRAGQRLPVLRQAAESAARISTPRATAHSLDEPCYIVEPHPPGTRLVAKRPARLHALLRNDDDGDRKLGTRLAPALHRARRRRVSRARERQPRRRRRPLRLPPRRARGAPGLRRAHR